MKRKDAKKILAFSLAGAIALGGMYIPGTDVQAADSTLTDGLTAWYDFDGGSLNMESKTVTNQAAGDGRLADGTLASNGASVSISEGTGISGSGLHFTQETTSYFQINNAINTGQAYTISLWVKFAENSSNDQTNIVQQTDANGKTGRTILFASNKVLGGFVGGANILTPSQVISYGEWTHLVVSGGSKNAATSKNTYSIYVNGELMKSEQVNYSNLTDAVTPLRFGCHKNLSGPYKGDMDSIRVYNKEADQALVDALYEEHTAKKYTVTAKDYTGGKVTCEGNDFTSGRFTYGDTAKLKAVADEGYDFSYWCDADTKKVLSNTADLDLIVLNTRNVTPVFTEQGSSAYTATFILPEEPFASKIVAKADAVDGKFAIPSVTLPSGYELKKWIGSDGTSYDAGVTETSEVTSNIIFVAEIEKVTPPELSMFGKGIYYNVNGPYAKVDGSSEIVSYGYCAYDSILHLAAPETKTNNEGVPEKFVCWKASYDNRNFFTVSSNTNLTWVVKTMILLKPEYAAEAPAPSDAPTVALGISSRTKAADSQKDNLRLQVLYDGVTGATVVEKGILLTWDDNSKDKLNIEDADSSVKRFYSNGTAQTGSYILNATLGVNTSANNTVYYVGYVTYKDSTGALNTIYTASASLPPTTAD